MAQPNADKYYVPHGTNWPIIGSIGLFVLFSGFANVLHESDIGWPLFGTGLAIIIYMVVKWFSQVVAESQDGYYNSQVDISFRLSMGWFIFSEVMFFAAFFGALFYVRVFTVPWLGGAEDTIGMFNKEIWPNFSASWPLLQMPSAANYSTPTDIVPAFGVPLANTLILLLSGVTITAAHVYLKKQQRIQLNWYMLATVVLGIIFLYLQAEEYVHAYQDLNLKLDSGIYGSTFFMLTGFHGLHVTLGTIMLIVILFRCVKGHFTQENHFAFEAVAWYWHFVDVVWLGLWFFVYFL